MKRILSTAISALWLAVLGGPLFAATGKLAGNPAGPISHSANILIAPIQLHQPRSLPPSTLEPLILPDLQDVPNLAIPQTLEASKTAPVKATDKEEKPASALKSLLIHGPMAGRAAQASNDSQASDLARKDFFLAIGESLPPDPEAWGKFLLETTSRPRKDIPVLGPYRALADRLPEHIKTTLLKEIGEQYPRAAKMDETNPNKSGLEEHHPKRLLDAWIRVLLPADKIITASLHQHHDPLTAYQDYLSAVKEKIFGLAPTRAGYGTLTARDIWEISVGIQKALREFKTFWGPYKIGLFGSVTKGLSKSGSDLDMAVTIKNYPRHRHDKAFLKGLSTLTGRRVPGIIERVQAIIKQRHPGFFLEVNHFSADITNIGSMNPPEPLTIEISADNIYLVLYSHETKLSYEDPRRRSVYTAPHVTKIQLPSPPPPKTR